MNFIRVSPPGWCHPGWFPAAIPHSNATESIGLAVSKSSVRLTGAVWVWASYSHLCASVHGLTWHWPGHRCPADGKVTMGLAERNGSLFAGFWVISPAGWLPGNWDWLQVLCCDYEYGLPLLIPFNSCYSSWWQAPYGLRTPSSTHKTDD